MDYKERNGIFLYPITSRVGMAHYNDHLKFRGRIYAENPRTLRKQPSKIDYEEYVYLKEQAPDFDIFATKASKRKAKKRLNEYESDYDWRDSIISNKNDKNGLVSILGEIIVPCQFTEIRERTTSILNPQPFIPVKVYDDWGIISTGKNPVCALPFAYQNILTERWERQLFFVQGWDDLWGVFRIKNDYYDKNSTTDTPFTICSIEPFAPCEYDDISEGELQDTCHPSTFWILHKNEKIGIMTPYSYTDAIFDSVELDHVEMAFTLFNGNGSVKLSYFEVGQPFAVESIL